MFAGRPLMVHLPYHTNIFSESTCSLTRKLQMPTESLPFKCCRMRCQIFSSQLQVCIPFLWRIGSIAIETTDSPAGDFHKLVGHVGILENAYLQTIKGAALLLWHKNVVLILLDLPVYKRTKNPGFFIIIH
jgi:hypothetical protein